MKQTDFHHDILESISDGVFTVDTEWKITSFNRAAQMITGVSRKNAEGQFCFEVFKSNMCESSCPLRKTIETGEPLVDVPGFCVAKDGQRIPISVSTSVFKDSEGKILGGAETFRDLTEIEQLKNEIAERTKQTLFTSKSPSLAHLLDMLPSASDSGSSILIQGETGTGKEVLARTIHHMSGRKNKPFIAVNCGALPEPLLESELFGYKKGAFTGADRDKPGRFALANGGTLFLDEIGDITSAMQVKLLRVLQEHEYEPLGAVKSEKTDVRILAASNKDIAELVEKGSFRSDLYYRLNIITLYIPPLRDRPEDIPSLAEDFLHKYAQRSSKRITSFDADVFSCFFAYSWPGNIRELENAVERMTVLAKGSVLTADTLPPPIQKMCIQPQTDRVNDTDQGGNSAISERAAPADRAVKTGSANPLPEAATISAAEPLSAAEAERIFILHALEKHRWNRSLTAQSLGINASTLWRKMKKLNISGRP